MKSYNPNSSEIKTSQKKKKFILFEWLIQSWRFSCSGFRIRWFQIKIKLVKYNNNKNKIKRNIMFDLLLNFYFITIDFVVWLFFFICKQRLFKNSFDLLLLFWFYSFVRVIFFIFIMFRRRRRRLILSFFYQINFFFINVNEIIYKWSKI